MPPERSSTYRTVAAIVAAALVAYLPAFCAGFVFDDHALIQASEALRGPLWRIWFTSDLPDFWPLTWTTLWVEWRVWGDWAAGYHATNLALPACTAVLVWRVLTALRVPGAWLAGVLFAVHPVTVESAAWISERKNTLSAALLLAAFLWWLRFDARGRARDGLLALGAYALALLSKTSVVMAPFVALGIVHVRRGRVERSDLLRMAPAFGLSLALGVATLTFQRANPMAHWWLPPRGAVERVGGAAWALVSYVQKAFAPFNLSFAYPEWPVAWTSPWFYAPLLACGIASASLWLLRARHWARAIAWALGFHALMLLPVLGLVDMAYLKIAPVANHLQYVPLIGPVALCAAGAEWARHRWPRAASAGAVAAVVILGGVTFDRARSFRDDLSLWQEAARAAPGSVTAHGELAGHLLAIERRDEAIAHLESAARVARRPEARHRARSAWLLQIGRIEEAIAESRAAVRLTPDPFARRDLGVQLALAGHHEEAIEVLTALVDEAPEDTDFRFWLARTLAESGRTDAAAQVLLRACGGGACDRPLRMLLAELYARMGRRVEAAAELAEASGLPVGDPRVQSRVDAWAAGPR